MKFRLKTLLFMISAMALLLALSVNLHQRFQADVAVMEEIERKHGVPMMVVNLSHQPQPAGGYHRLDHGKFVPTEIHAWGDDTTPRWASFLPKFMKVYCFSRITSVSVTSDTVSKELLIDLTQLRGLKYVSVNVGSIELDSLKAIQENYPGIKFDSLERIDWSDF